MISFEDLHQHRRTLLDFIVPGNPVGKGRPRVTTRGGYARAYTPNKTKEWEKKAASLAHWRSPPHEGKVEVIFYAVKTRPRDLCRRKDPSGLIWRDVKPDIDNVAKCILDALVMAGVLKDDTQVVSLMGKNLFSGKDRKPFTHIVVKEVLDEAVDP